MGKLKERLPRILKPTDRVKRTFVITADTDVRLSTASKRRGIDRSDLAERILSANLPRVTVTEDAREGGQGEAVA